MIVKKIQRQSADASPSAKASYVNTLTTYVTNATALVNGRSRKVAYWGGRGFLSNDLPGMQAEMAALAHTAVRSDSPITHWVLSWQEGEQPTHEQVEVVVSMFMADLGLESHQVIYALHAAADILSSIETHVDAKPEQEHTRNTHLHLAVSRVHPLTHRVIKPGGGLDLEAAHRAIARIEHVQGWESEPNARYCLQDGKIVRTQPPSRTGSEPGQLQRDAENRTGEMSAMRQASLMAAPLIAKASNWNELHASLRKVGMQYVKTGSGAVIKVGDVAVKSSSVDRNASLGRLQKRLGIYEPDSDTSPFPPLQQSVPVYAAALGWQEYISARTAYYQEKKVAYSDMEESLEAQRKKLKEEHRSQRKHILSGKWRGLGQSLNAMRSVLAAEQAAAKAALKDDQRRARALNRQKFPPFPGYEDWLRRKGLDEDADEWRYRNRLPPAFAGLDTAPPSPRDIRAFQARVVGGRVCYYGQGLNIGPAFVDRGVTVEVHRADDDQVILAAMQLAVQKFGVFSVSGSPEFMQTCVRIAAEHGIRIGNPELQVQLDLEFQRVRELLRSKAVMQRHRPGRTEGATPNGTMLAIESEISISNPLVGHRAQPGISRNASSTTPGMSETNSETKPAPVTIPTDLTAALGSNPSTGVAGYADGYVKAVGAFSDRHVDFSRIDAQIALQMRAAQFTRVQIEEAIEQCAPRIRTLPETRNWGEYARIAAGYAWSAPAAQWLSARQLYTDPTDSILEIDKGGPRRTDLSQGTAWAKVRPSQSRP